MSKSLRTLVLAAASVAVVGTTVAQAAPMTLAPAAAVGFDKSASSVEQVQFRRRYYGGRYYGRRGYGYNAGGALVAGAALGLLGAGVAAAAAPSYGYGYGYGYPAYGYGYGYGYPAYGYGW